MCQKEITDLLEKVKSERDGFSYGIREIQRVIPTMTAKDAPVVTSVASAIQNVLGKPAEYVISPGSYDQKHIDRIGQLKNCIAYGPGILELAHQPDEYVEVSAMIDSAKIMGQSLIDLLVD